jgi:hypothetical protein
MGKVVKDIAVSYRGCKPYHVEARVDTGADATVISKAVADKLEVQILDRKPCCVQGFDGIDVYGYTMPIEVGLDNRTESVSAFVPVYRLSDEGKRKSVTLKTNLLGHDFLQRAGATLSLADPHTLTLSPRQDINYLRLVPLSEKERKFLKEHAAEALALPKEERQRKDAEKLTRQVRSLLKKK